MRALPIEAEQFLVGLRVALGKLPSAEREDIVAEIRSHLEERAARGEPYLVGRFGPPEQLAASFLQERGPARAAGARDRWGSALRAGGRRAVRWYAFALAAALFVYGAAFLAMLVLKVIFPSQVGMFVAPGYFQLGANFGPDVAQTHQGARELLGGWGAPFFLAVGAACLGCAAWILRAARGRLAVRRAR